MDGLRFAVKTCTKNEDERKSEKEDEKMFLLSLMFYIHEVVVLWLKSS